MHDCILFYNCVNEGAVTFTFNVKSSVVRSTEFPPFFVFEDQRLTLLWSGIHIIQFGNNKCL